MVRRISLLCCIFILIFAFNVQAVDEKAEVELKNALQQLHLVEDFQGEITTKIYVSDSELSYQIGLLKSDGRADVSKNQTFWRLKGTDQVRKIRTIPWFYLPPDFSLVQHALPIQHKALLDEPLKRIEDEYQINILEDDGQQIIFELDNGLVYQKVYMDKENSLINKIEILNAAEKSIAEINYTNWTEYYSGVYLPEGVKVFDEQKNLLMELTYQNWKVNQGVSRFASLIPVEWNKEIEDLKEKVLDDPGNDRYHFELAKLYQKKEYWNKALVELDKAHALNPTVEYQEEMAKIYKKLGRYQQAINTMLTVLDQKETASSHYMLGELYTLVNNPLLARQSYEKAVKLNGDNIEYLERLFWNYRSSSNNDPLMVKKAIKTGEKLVELVPQGFQYRIYLGDLYLKNDDSDEAFEQYQRAQELEPANSLPLIKIARYHEQESEIRQATEFFKKAIKAEEHWWNYLQLGDYYMRQAEIENALSAYKSSLQLNPRNTDLTIKMGRVLWELGRKEEAKNYWEKALLFEESNIYTYIKVGEILEQYNLSEEAEAIFKKAIKNFRLLDTPGVQSGLSKVYEKLGLMHLEEDAKSAMQSFEQAYQHQPRSIPAQYLGLRKLKKGQLKEAMAYWNEANLLDGDNIRPYIYMTVTKGLRGELAGTADEKLDFMEDFINIREEKMLTKLFRYFETVRDIQDEVENTPTLAQEAYQSGMEAYKNGHLTEAISDFKRAVKEDPQFKKGHFFLGVCYSLQGRSEEAKKHYTMIKKYYAGGNAARIVDELDQIISQLFWKIDIA